MNKIFLFTLKIYISIGLLLGIFLFLFNPRNLLAYLGTSLLGLTDFYFIYLTLKNRQNIDSRRVIMGMFLRLFCITFVILLLDICGIINKLNVLGMLLGVIVYPTALFIGGIRVLRWKK